MQIEKDGVILRDMTENDIEDYVRWFTVETGWSDTDAPWEPIDTDEQTERKAWQEYYAAVKDLPDTVLRRKFEIERNGRHVGWVSRYGIDEHYEWTKDPTDRVAVGIDICEPDIRGRGVGAAALSAFAEYLFENSAQTVYTQTWSGNVRMVRCAEKIGFTECSRRIGVRTVNGKHYDALTLVLQRDAADRGGEHAQTDRRE